MKVPFIILGFFMILTCCSADREQVEKYNYDTSFQLSLKDKNQNDLLNPANANAYNQSNIKVYYLTNGEMVEVYNKDKDYPRNFRVFKQGDQYRIMIYLNHESNSDLAETFIYWNDSQFERISAKTMRSNSVVTLEKVWINQDEVWKSSSNKERYYQLTK